MKLLLAIRFVLTILALAMLAIVVCAGSADAQVIVVPAQPVPVQPIPVQPPIVVVPVAPAVQPWSYPVLQWRINRQRARYGLPPIVYQPAVVQPPVVVVPVAPAK